jgi:penicillin-binding protein 2
MASGRMLVFAGTLAVIVAVLIARLWYLQIVRGESYREMAAKNRTHKVRRVPPRGVIEDRLGRPLVTNAAQITVFVVPSELPKMRRPRFAGKPTDAERKGAWAAAQEAVLDDVFGRLAPLLETSVAELKAIYLRRKTGGPTDPVSLREGISQHMLARVEEHKAELPGIIAQVEPVRRYPNGKLAAHVLGHIGPLDAEDMKDPATQQRGYRPGDFTGKNGIEKAHDDLLCGVAGATVYDVDAGRHRQREIGEVPPVAGARLTLTIDRDVQRVAESALSGKPGAVVAIDPRNGRIVAMASYPTFDPNLFVHRPLSTATYDTQISPGLTNKAIQGGGAPGSTFKMITAAAGLASGKLSDNSGAFCNGRLKIGNRFFKCHKLSGHGSVSFTEAIAQSCDVFFYVHGRRIGPRVIAQWARKFGFDEKTGIDLPGETRRSRVPDPEWKARMAPIFNPKTPDTGWYDGDTANVSIGQGDIIATPLQVALISAAIGGGGTIYRPHLLQQAIASDGSRAVLYDDTKNRDVLSTLGLSTGQLAVLDQSMRTTVRSGTATSVQIPGLVVAGKTGTAQVFGRRNGKALPPNSADAWFTGYASRPGEKPSIAICVWRESEGGNLHGGSEAGPIARKVIAAYFKVQDTGQAGGYAPD